MEMINGLGRVSAGTGVVLPGEGKSEGIKKEYNRKHRTQWTFHDAGQRVSLAKFIAIQTCLHDIFVVATVSRHSWVSDIR